MLTHAFTCTGPYAVLIMLGIKRTENRGTRPPTGKGRCAVSCSKSFCKEEYGEFVRWAARALDEDDFARLPSWGDVKDWPGRIVGAVDYEVRSKSEKVKVKSCGFGIPLGSAGGEVGGETWDEGLAHWWDLSEVVCFDAPIACRGSVGMWEMPRELAAQVTRADALARCVGERVASAEDAARIFCLAMPIAGGNEGLFVLPLDAERRVLSEPILVSLGEPTTTAVNPADVFLAALKAGASAIIIAHNHPSGNPTPSEQDAELTAKLQTVGTTLGVSLLDHLIVTDRSYCSSVEVCKKKVDSRYRELGRREVDHPRHWKTSRESIVEHQFTEGDIQKLVMIMDMHGYEQDGDAPVFANMNEQGDPVCFATWEAVYDFVISKFGK